MKVHVGLGIENAKWVGLATLCRNLIKIPSPARKNDLVVATPGPVKDRVGQFANLGGFAAGSEYPVELAAAAESEGTAIVRPN